MNGGYVTVKMPGHARADNCGYVREHILVVEAAMGKPLRRSAEVHHVDENRTNNAPANLVVCESHAYHALLHRRARALRECGDASARRCALCGGYDDQPGMSTYRGSHGIDAYHRRCKADRARGRYASRRLAALEAEDELRAGSVSDV